MSGIKTYPYISAFAIRNRYDLVARIWYAVRHLDQAGCGWVDAEQAGQSLRYYEISKAHMRAAQASAGWDVFFQRTDDGKLHYKGVLAIYREQQLVGDHYAVNVPPVTIRRVAVFRRYQYAAYIAAFKRTGVTISRARLEQIFGVEQTALRRWEKQLGIVTVQSNHAYCTDDDIAAAVQHLPKDAEGASVFVPCASGGWVGQMPNHYSVEKMDVVSAGKARKGPGVPKDDALPKVFYRLSDQEKLPWETPSKTPCLIELGVDRSRRRPSGSYAVSFRRPTRKQLELA